ncbi:GUN4 domain-containing protein [Okeania sp.]|uniref:GUN4 domain-containing protein n=1 Tax=Okeania sp. TaxID=3100323 RepID=UPI002B4ABE07|nr:GUN4 domain-containing protein [Okeania sp.]MEB3339499.1 GUN4 domain-containing protein [Okeania sp.]
MEIQPEDRPQTVQEWLRLLQVKPQNIMSKMSQVSQRIMSQMATLKIPGVQPIYQKYISQNYVKSFYTGEANGLLMGIGVFIFVVIIYIFSPKLHFSINSSPSIDKEIDYTALENLLSSDKFEEADEETLKILLSLVGRENNYWLDLEHIENIPCQDLDKINQLWIYYSNGKFGFSIQKEIWI